MHYIFLCACLLTLLQGCATQRTDEQTLPPWLAQHLKAAHPTDELCPLPTGTFLVKGTSSNPDFPYDLDDLLFEDKLAGYPVYRILISEGKPNRSLVITGILAGYPLEKFQKIIEAKGLNCNEKWSFDISTGAINSTVRSDFIVKTAALIIPLSEKNYLQLHKAKDGALLVRVKSVSWVLGALSIPFKMEEEFWIRYGDENEISKATTESTADHL